MGVGVANQHLFTVRSILTRPPLPPSVFWFMLEPFTWCSMVTASILYLDSVVMWDDTTLMVNLWTIPPCTVRMWFQRALDFFLEAMSLR